MTGKKKVSLAKTTELTLFFPDPLLEEEEQQEEAPEGLLLPRFFFLNNNTALVGMVAGIDTDTISLALPYKVEMVRDSDGLYTRLRLFYPKSCINLYKYGIMYDAPPIPSVEYRFISTLLCDRKREFQRVLFDHGLDQEANFEYLKQRKIELEQKSVK